MNKHMRCLITGGLLFVAVAGGVLILAVVGMGAMKATAAMGGPWYVVPAWVAISVIAIYIIGYRNTASDGEERSKRGDA